MTQNVALVTGGTGFTGRYLLRRLCELGFEVRCIKRKNSKTDDLADLEIKWYEGNVYDAELLEEAMESVTQVYHVAAAYRATNLPDQELVDVHLTSTKILAELALKQPNFERFVHCSTVGVLGHIENPPADESTPYNPGDIYQETKADAEKWLVEFSNNSGLPYTVVRPAAIYGPGDRRLLKLFKMARLPLIPLFGFTKGLYHLIHVEDLVEFMWYSTTTKETLSQIYICGNPEPSSIKSMLKIIANNNGRHAHFIRIPSSPIFMIAKVIEKLSKFFNVEPFLYPRRVAFFTKDRAFDTSKLASVKGFEYKYTEEKGIRALDEWYKEQKWL